MKITVYSKPFFPQMGGLERNTQTLCTALKEAGHRVELITETSADKTDNYGFRVIRKPSLDDYFRHVREADLLITNGGNIPLLPAVIAYLLGTKHGAIYHGFRGFQSKSSSIFGQLKSALCHMLAQNASFNIFTSTHSKKMTDLPKENSYVFLNPVDKSLEKFYTRDCVCSKADGPFLFAGRLIKGKGIFVLANALERIDGNQHVKLMIAGAGQDESEFRARTRSLKTVDVELLGRVQGKKLVSLYKQSRALIVPSTTHDEGNPLVIAEALYAGTPVIASDQPPMIESVGEAGIIVEKGNSKDLADAISKINTDRTYRKSLFERAEERKNLFSYRRYKKRIKKVVKDNVV